MDTLTVVRGECKTFMADPTAAGKSIDFGTDDYVELTVRTLPNADSPILLQKRSEAGSKYIELHESDTMIEPGQYSAEVRYYTNGCVYSIWGAESTKANRNAKNFEVLAGAGVTDGE